MNLIKSKSISWRAKDWFRKLQSAHELEKIVLVFVALVLWGWLSHFLYIEHIKNQVGDTTFVAQILYNFRHSWKSDTSFGASTIESMGRIWYRDAKTVCSTNLSTTLPTTSWWHMYFVMYLLFPFSNFIDIQILIAIVHAGFYTAILIFSYLIVRKKGTAIIPSCLFVVLITQHPLWSIGLEGQFYFNRFFLLFSSILILLLESVKKRYLLIGFVSLLAAGSNEIYGITVCMLMLSSLWVQKKLDIKMVAYSFFFLVLGIVLVISLQKIFPYASTQTSFMQSTFHGGVVPIIQKFLLNAYTEKTLVFFVVNMLFVGILSSFHPRAFLALFGMFIPNLFVNIGGAEKTGWATHYHMAYFTALIWLSAVGLSILCKRPKIQIGILLLLILISTWIDPYTLNILKKPSITIVRLYRVSQYHKMHQKYDFEFKEKLLTAVGDGSSASVPEAIAYNLYKHELYYYPMNIDRVDVVILRYDPTKNGTERYSSINYGHQDSQLDVCIFEKMKNADFDFGNPIIVDEWAVFHKKAQE